MDIQIEMKILVQGLRNAQVIKLAATTACNYQEYIQGLNNEL